MEELSTNEVNLVFKLSKILKVMDDNRNVVFYKVYRLTRFSYKVSVVCKKGILTFYVSDERRTVLKSETFDKLTDYSLDEYQLARTILKPKP